MDKNIMKKTLSLIILSVVCFTTFAANDWKKMDVKTIWIADGVDPCVLFAETVFDPSNGGSIQWYKFDEIGSGLTNGEKAVYAALIAAKNNGNKVFVLTDATITGVRTFTNIMLVD
jgi:hypothetical protein